MIGDYLSVGKDNARTGKELAKLLHCNVRDVRSSICSARRKGQPIIASCDPEQPGYYLAETAEEVKQYCDSLERRAGEIHATRYALLLAANEMQEDGQCTINE